MVNTSTAVIMMVLLVMFTSIAGDRPIGCACRGSNPDYPKGYYGSPQWPYNGPYPGPGFFYNPGPGDIPYYGCEGGCNARPDFSRSILGYSGPIDPVPCCEFCCKLVPTKPEPATCKPDNNACSGRSHIGYQLTYYEYFAGSQSAGKGGGAHYCPKGTGGYADCNAACDGEINLDNCVNCCNVCCKLAPTKPEPATCKPDSNVCSRKSHIGYQLSYYEYFAGSQSAGKGGGAYYCPKGIGGYADCNAACDGEVYLDNCVDCCNVCCKPDEVKTRAFNDDNEDFAAFLHDGARNQYNHDRR